MTITNSISPRTATEARGTFLNGYVGAGRSHDELVAADGSLRPQWRTFVHAMDELGFDEFTRRWQEAKQIIRENGVTYNIHGDPSGLERPWQLDPIPILVEAQEADALETGLTQRARLLEAILRDLYGPQTLLREGLIPRELVFAHPGFLRPCRGLQLPGGRFLHLAAMDLVRLPDGAIGVLRDRTQAPSGAGYALENRMVLSRMLPEVFRDCRVQRLALFFRTFRDTLRALAPTNRDNPRTVLLTPGPYNETYFEHAYLARYLGYTLAEGGDLTVRDNRVYLKLLDGLQPVDVIFRRLDDDYCDPLELRGDSFLGVPGLVQVVRSGNVALANPLGSGLVETPGLAPYLPKLSRHLLGEKLLIPSVPVYWCGDAEARAYVIANLDRMLIKPTFPSLRMNSIFGEKLFPEQKRALIEKMNANPAAYVGQDHVDLSTGPVLTEGGVEACRLVVRAFLCATEEKFTLMPGALTRVASMNDSMAKSIQGGGSKDTWVLSNGPISTFSLLRPTVQPVALSRGGNDLPSRAADNLFWLGRYVERADGAVRLLRGIVVRLIDRSGTSDVPELPLLLAALTKLTRGVPGFVGEGAETRLTAPEPELFALVYDRKRAGSLANSLGLLHRVAGSVRDRISMDMWRVLAALDLDDNHQGEPLALEDYSLTDVLELLNGMVITLAAFGGLTRESMTRSHGWRFLDMGRRIERSSHLVALIRTTLSNVPTCEGPLLEALLEIADSSMTFRRRYLSSLQTAPVLDLLLADESNPRSLAYQLIQLREDVEELPRDPRADRSPEQRLALSLLTTMQLAEIDRIALASNDGGLYHLQDLLSTLEAQIPRLSDAITLNFLTHLQTSRHLAGAEGIRGQESGDRNP